MSRVQRVGILAILVVVAVWLVGAFTGEVLSLWVVLACYALVVGGALAWIWGS